MTVARYKTISGTSGSPFAGVTPGVVQGVGHRHQQYPRTAAAMAAAFGGRTPSHGWLFDQPGPDATPLFGGVTLSEVNTIDEFQVPTPYAGRRAIGAADGDNGSLQAENTSIFDDDGVTSFGFLGQIRFADPPATSTSRSYLGKREGGVAWYAGFIQAATGYMAFYIYDGTVVKQATVNLSVAGVDTWLFVSVDRANSLLRLHTRLGSSTIDMSGVGSLANGEEFAVTALLGSFFSCGGDFVALYRFEGANAEGDPSVEFTDFQRYVDAA